MISTAWLGTVPCCLVQHNNEHMMHCQHCVYTAKIHIASNKTDSSACLVQLTTYLTGCYYLYHLRGEKNKIFTKLLADSSNITD